MTHKPKTPIITFTANMVAETTYYVDRWEPGKVSRAKQERFQVGGKGINVSKMLRRLSADTTALCFPGGSFGPTCQRWLETNGIPYKGFTDGCETRSGSIIRAPGEKEISILGLDCRVSRAAVHACVDYLSQLTGPYLLAVCGVVPDWESEVWNPLRDWLPRRDPSIALAVDTYGPGLKWFAQQSPALVKINRDELELLFDKDVSAQPTEVLLEEAASAFDCPQWIITDGRQPIWAKVRGEPCLSVQPRTVEAVSPVGCGDVFFATLLDGLYHHPENAFREILERAAEYASRNAASHGIADFDLG